MISIAWWQLLLALVIGEAGYSFFRAFVRSLWRQIFPYCEITGCRVAVEHTHEQDEQGPFINVPLTSAVIKGLQFRPDPYHSATRAKLDG